MYIIKNALKSIGRSKGRNALIGLIALVIATSACIGLSIRQAAESAKSSTLQGMSVTATISYDRTGAMNNIGQMGSGGIPNFDKDMFADLIGGRSSMTLEEYQIYAAAESVQNFYYTLTAYVNGSESFLPVSDSGSSDSSDDSGNGFFPGNFGDMFGSGGMPNMPNMPNSSGGSDFSNIFNSAADYITQVDSAMNLTVVLQMIGVGLLLTLIASAASVMFVMRYDPLKILANRD